MAVNAFPFRISWQTTSKKTLIQFTFITWADLIWLFVWLYESSSFQQHFALLNMVIEHHFQVAVVLLASLSPYQYSVHSGVALIVIQFRQFLSINCNYYRLFLLLLLLQCISFILEKINWYKSVLLGSSVLRVGNNSFYIIIYPI